MSGAGFAQLVILLVALVATVVPLGRYLARVYGASPHGTAPGERIFGPVERWCYRLMRVDPRREQRWNVYAVSLLAFSVWSFLAVYLLQRAQGWLPLNPTDAPAVRPTGAFSVAVSFVTNTNWQWYAGEVTMSHLTQMLALTVQNVVSAAAGMAVAIAIVRGIARANAGTLGSFWVDLVRTVVRVLLPMAFVGALVLAGLGVVQNLRGSTTVRPLDATAQEVQHLPGGLIASQESIKQLGTNGGGPYNANSVHPFENPNGWTNLVETYMILVLPLAMVVAFGHLVGSRRQAGVLLAVMMAIWASVSLVTIFAEQQGNPELTALGADQSLSAAQSGGNMEGKDVRIGPSSCGVWVGSTTGTSNGSVSCQHDSLTPVAGGVAMLHMMLGEVSPGGVGVGLMGILVDALIAVFIAGLMVGRTPEYLGKKIQAAEVKLVTLYLIAMPLALLGFAAAAVLIPSATASMGNPGPHGLSEVLYAYASAANNNGSAFAGLSAGTDWYTITQGLAMLVGRFFLIIPALAVGGSLVRKQRVPVTSGTMPTDTALFAGLVLGVALVVAGLTFFPALALGPVVEQLSL